MNIKNILTLALAIGAAVSVQATNVGVLLGRSGHNKEWDHEFDKLGWDVSRYECTPDGMKNFAESSASLDFVLVPPLFNWQKVNGKEEWILPKDGDYSMIRKYVEEGGMIVVTEAQYKPCQEFFARVDGAFSVNTGKCTSSPWVVLGHTSNIEPTHPLRCFPNNIVERDNWAHFEIPAGSNWKPIAVCSEGKPSTIVQDFGKGCIVFVAMRHNRLDALENYYAYALAHRYGVSISKFAMPALTAGDGSIEMELSEAPQGGASISYVLANEKGKKVSFSTNFVGKTATLAYNVALRGKVNSSFYLTTPKGRVALFTRTADIAPLFVVKPNWYRGMISTKRRVETVDFKVEFAPNHEILNGAKLSFTVFDGCGNQVGTTTEHLMPTNGEVALEQWLPVPLAKKLGAGEYRLDAKAVFKPWKKGQGPIEARSSTNFEIRAPKWNQVMIDDDGTFLVNGVPYMPLAIYHCGPKDIPAIADIGFNTMQFWGWHLGGWGATPMLSGVGMACAYQIRCLFEGFPHGNRDWLNFIFGHPATFGYYVGDEPCEGAEPALEKMQKIWSEDKDHPCYIDSCRPDLFHIHQRYCDILSSNGGGIDILMGKATLGGHKACCLTPGCERFDDPENPECYRGTFFHGLAQGLRGFFWYCWAQEGGGPIGAGLKCQPKSQEVFKSMFKEAKAMFPGLLSTKRRPFALSKNVQGMVCGTEGGRRFLILANRGKDAAEVDIEVPELNGVKKVFVPFNLPKVQKKNDKGELVFNDKKEPVMVEQTTELEGGRVKVTLPGYGRLVYRW